MNRRLRVAVFVVGMLVPSMVFGQTPADPTAGATLQPGDVVRIAVWQRPEFSGEFVVAPDGSLTHPLYRAVHVAGVPLRDAEDRVRQFLGQFVAQPAFSFSALLRVFVGGEVRQPNTLTLPPGTTVAQAIALVGGPSDRADVHDLRVIRGDQVIAIDLAGQDASSARTTIRSGDQIVVGRAKSGFKDAVGPVSAVLAALAGITSIVLQLRK